MNSPGADYPPLRAAENMLKSIRCNKVPFFQHLPHIRDTDRQWSQKSHRPWMKSAGPISLSPDSYGIQVLDEDRMLCRPGNRLEDTNITERGGLLLLTPTRRLTYTCHFNSTIFFVCITSPAWKRYRYTPVGTCLPVSSFPSHSI